MKVRASVVALIALAVFSSTSAESWSCSAPTSSSQTQTKPKNHEHVQQWCRTAEINAPDTWVYRFHDPVTGEEGYIRGRGAAEIWKRLHRKGGIALHCR